MSSWVPSTWMGCWTLFVGVTALYNTYQCYTKPPFRQTERIYALQPKQITDFASRMFGNYTLAVAVIRIICAYHLSIEPMYKLLMLTYVMSGGSYILEIFVYKTAPVSSPGVWPALIISSGTFTWMALNL
ncbi:hypothetical protein BJ742DRAFT_795509 [Cladochytrium replicatum]|nr:hypothetical protein BJ742DRAFT_795509 [Cladochytrium replicatum]